MPDYVDIFRVHSDSRGTGFDFFRGIAAAISAVISSAVAAISAIARRIVIAATSGWGSGGWGRAWGWVVTSARRVVIAAASRGGWCWRCSGVWTCAWTWTWTWRWVITSASGG